MGEYANTNLTKIMLSVIAFVVTALNLILLSSVLFKF